MPKTEFLKAEDETPEGGLPQTGLKGQRFKDYLATKRKFDGNSAAWKKAKKQRDADKFPDEVPVDPEKMKRHDTGASNIDPSKMRSKFHQKKFEKHKKSYQDRIEQVTRAEVLNEEESGALEAEDGELTYLIRQSDIAANVDLANASKYFELHLNQFGPYHIDYTDNGRHLIIGGSKGHVASLDWPTKKLHCEFNSMELIRDVAWLHTENMYAVAQKHYTYFYDNRGTEMHCVKGLYEAMQLEFLPRHFLLVAGGKNSFLHYLDVSIGKMITSYVTKMGQLDVMCQNPANAIIHTGHSNGTVSLWSPNIKEPLVRILAHPSSVKGVAVDDSGKYMVTTGLDLKARVWDVRMYKQMHCYALPYGLNRVAISQKKMVACAVGNTVQIFKDMHIGSCHEPYLTHRCSGPVSDLSFVPYEDVLGVGHAGGFTSMLVPGAGEPNVDAFRANPYETKKQRKEREVKQLLDKLQPELICLDPNDISKVNENLLEQAEEERKKILYVRPVPIEYTPRHKMRGRGSGNHKEMRKNVVKGDIRVDHNKQKEQLEKELFGRGEKNGSEKPKAVLDRFKQ